MQARVLLRLIALWSSGRGLQIGLIFICHAGRHAFLLLVLFLRKGRIYFFLPPLSMRCFITVVTAGLTATALLSRLADATGNGTSTTTPMQLRLAYAGSTGMVISWNTFSQMPNPTVRYGRSPSALTERASSNISVTYPTSLTFNNHVKITGLQPNTLYYYQPENSNSSTPFTFKTSRAAGDGAPYSIAVVVDRGLSGPQGLTTHVGTGAANPLGPHDKNTVQSLQQDSSEYEFLWHR